MSMIPTGPGGGGKPYKGDNPIVPTTKDLTIDKGTLITKPLVISAVEDLTPEVTVQTPLVQEILESLVGKVTLANATADKIIEGYSAYVGQKLIVGTKKNDMDYGKVILNSDAATITVNHNLGVVPTYALILPDSATTTFDTTNLVQYSKISNIYNTYKGIHAYLGGSTTSLSAIFTTDDKIARTTSLLTFNESNANYKFKAACSYLWIAIA